MQASTKPFMFAWQVNFWAHFTCCLWAHNQSLVNFSFWPHMNINHQSGHAWFNTCYDCCVIHKFETVSDYCLSYKGKLTSCKIWIMILRKWVPDFLRWCISTASVILRLINFMKSKGSIAPQNVNKMLMTYVVFSGECFMQQYLMPFEIFGYWNMMPYCQVSNISRTLVGCFSCIFILNLTAGFIGLGEDKCTRRQETSKFGDFSYIRDFTVLSFMTVRLDFVQYRKVLYRKAWACLLNLVLVVH